jgi:hypothetical protein
MSTNFISGFGFESKDPFRIKQHLYYRTIYLYGTIQTLISYVPDRYSLCLLYIYLTLYPHHTRRRRAKTTEKKVECSRHVPSLRLNNQLSIKNSLLVEYGSYGHHTVVVNQHTLRKS